MCENILLNMKAIKSKCGYQFDKVWKATPELLLLKYCELRGEETGETIPLTLFHRSGCPNYFVSIYIIALICQIITFVSQKPTV
jgi:hypothetical protein